MKSPVFKPHSIRGGSYKRGRELPSIGRLDIPGFVEKAVSFVSRRREGGEEQSLGRGDMRCGRQQAGLRGESFVLCREEFPQRDLFWDSPPAFSSPQGRGQIFSSFSPTPLYSGVPGFRASIRRASRARRVSDRARIQGCPTARFACAPAIPTPNAADPWAGFPEVWEESRQTRLSNRGARHGRTEDSQDALVILFPSRASRDPLL